MRSLPRESVVKPATSTQQIRELVRSTLLFKGGCTLHRGSGSSTNSRDQLCKDIVGSIRAPHLTSLAHIAVLAAQACCIGFLLHASSAHCAPPVLLYPCAELDEEQEACVIDAMFERRVSAGEVVIR